MVKRSAILLGVLFGALGACQEPDPNYGDPNGIWGKRLPGEKAPSAATSADPGSVQAPTTSLATAHATAKAKAASAPTPDKPTDCMACHTGTVGPKFTFGGRVSSGAAGVAGAVVAVDGIPPVKSDADGYFWSESGTIAAGSKVKVNDSAMGTPLQADTGGACLSSTCHGATSPGPISP